MQTEYTTIVRCSRNTVIIKCGGVIHHYGCSPYQSSDEIRREAIRSCGTSNSIIVICWLDQYGVLHIL